MKEHVHTDSLSSAVEASRPSSPRIGFDIQRRLLLALLFACVLTALLLLLVLGVLHWRDLHVQASQAAERASVVAKEHADKVFELDAALTGRVEDLLADMSEDDIRAGQEVIHARLGRMIAGLPQISSVAVIGADGAVLAHSRDYPLPPLSVADRDYFQALKQGQQQVISSIVVGRQMQRQVFADGVARRAPDGRFLGVILVSLDPDYFLSFYQQMLPGELHQSLSLVREDGAILVRYPKMPNRIGQAPLSSPFMHSIKDGAKAGIVKGVSPLDQELKIISFRRVSNHPLYVVSTRSLAYIWQEWFSYMALAASLLLVPSSILCGIILFTIRRVKDQRIAWHLWQKELALRHQVESDLREAQKFEALGKLLGRVAHDFNNCLMVVATGIQIIRLKRVPDVEKQLEAIERSIKSGEQLTRQLLGVSRRQPLRPEMVILQTQLPEWQVRLFNSIGAARCSMDIDADTWPVCVDAVELQLALVNVLLNARDASASDSPIRLQTENISKHGSAVRSGYFVRISIQDQGRGMSETIRRQAFDPLFTTKEAGKGTGLGLSQVENFAKTAGGYAEIESISGGGTTVSLYLPAAEGAALTEPDQHASRVLRPLKLLLVEDNCDVADGMVTLLRTAGHTVTHAVNALAAEQFLAQQQVDAVISDIHMPGGITGIELAKKLNLQHPDLPVILISGYAEDLQAATKAGLSVIPKPFTQESITRQLAAKLT